MLIHAAYAASVLWFSAGAYTFTVGGREFMEDHMPEGASLHGVRLDETVLYAVRFVGGFNIAMALLCALRLRMITLATPPHKSESTVLLPVAVAHLTQFAFNTPSFALPNVVRWTTAMGFIYVTDLSMAVLCFAAAVAASRLPTRKAGVHQK